MSIDFRSCLPNALAKLERLPIFGLTLALLFGSLFVKYIHDVDMYWQLEFGAIICRTGAWPSFEPFLHGKEHVPNVPICWLSQVFYFQIWSLGGWPLLQIVEGALWIGGYAAVAWALRRQGAWGWPAALALLCGFLPSYTFASIRPQTFALLGFGLTMVLTWAEWKLWKKLLAGAILFVVWQNAHPSVLMAGAWLGPLTIGAVVRWLRRSSAQRGPFPWDFAGLSTLAVAAAFACPSPLETFELARANVSLTVIVSVRLRAHRLELEIESEMVFQFALHGREIAFVPIDVIYASERSKIRPLTDTVRWWKWYLGACRCAAAAKAAGQPFPAKSSTRVPCSIQAR